MSPIEIMIRAHLTARGTARTYHLAACFGVSTTVMRKALLRLERRGVVERHARYSAVNDICWVLAKDDASGRQPSPREDHPSSPKPQHSDGKE